MSLLRSRRATPAQAAANRANARKSIGPKTPGGSKMTSLNALKTGATAQAATRPMWQTMAELGEDPGRYRSLLRDVIGSYPPANPLELRLCEDITRLMLKSERIQQAQEAKLVRTYQRLESVRQKQRREMELSASYDALQAEVLETGLRRAPDSPAKFSETTACLERLVAQVERGDFSDETELSALYGKNPTFRGAGVINAFHALADNPGDRDLASSLRLMILEEMRDVAEESALYRQEHVEISRAMRLECLAPAADRDYIQLQRQDGAVHRQIERKIKLLLAMQAAAHRRTRGEIEEIASALPALEDEPLAWLDSAGVPIAAETSTRDRKAEPLQQQQARSIALRHKLGAPRPSGPSAKERHAEMMRKIYAVYGITPPDESAGKSLASPASGSQERVNPTGSRPADAPVEAAGEGSGASDVEQK